MALDPNSYHLTGSQDAADVLAELWKPSVGAGPYNDLTLAELNQRFNGTGAPRPHTFPTDQI